MEIKALSAQNYQRTLHFLILGKPGTGKTFSLMTLPRPLLIVDVEGGLSSIVNSGQNVDNIDFVNVTDFDELNTLLEHIDDKKYRSVAIDTYSSLQSFHVMKRFMKDNGMNYNEWNYLLQSLKNMFLSMRKRKCVFVVNIHEKIDSPSLAPLLQGQSSSEIFNYVDFVFRAVYNADDNKYLWIYRGDFMKFRGKAPEGNAIYQDFSKVIKYIESCVEEGKK